MLSLTADVLPLLCRESSSCRSITSSDPPATCPCRLFLKRRELPPFEELPPLTEGNLGAVEKKLLIDDCLLFSSTTGALGLPGNFLGLFWTRILSPGSSSSYSGRLASPPG